MKVIVIAIVLFIIIKLIFKAFRKENSGGINLELKKEIKIDGYYVCRYNGPSYLVPNIKLTLILIFTELGFTYYKDMEGHPTLSNEEMKRIISSLTYEKQLRQNFGRYQVSQNGDVEVILLDPHDTVNKDLSYPLEYKKFKGVITYDGLVLDYNQKNFKMHLQEFTENVILSKVKFKFIKIDLN